MLRVSINASADSEVVVIMAAATVAVVSGTLSSCKVSQLQRSEPTTSGIGLAPRVLG